MATEAICRIAFYLMKNHKELLDSICEEFPPPLKQVILGGKPSILKLLKGMRMFLRDINVDNSRISSFQIAKLNGQSFDDVKSEGAIWIDVCESFFCMYVGELDLFVRLSYNQLIFMEGRKDKLLVIAFQLEALPKRLSEAIPILTLDLLDRVELEFLNSEVSLSLEYVSCSVFYYQGTV